MDLPDQFLEQEYEEEEDEVDMYGIPSASGTAPPQAVMQQHYQIDNNLMMQQYAPVPTTYPSTSYGMQPQMYYQQEPPQQQMQQPLPQQQQPPQMMHIQQAPMIQQHHNGSPNGGAYHLMPRVYGIDSNGHPQMLSNNVYRPAVQPYHHPVIVQNAQPTPVQMLYHRPAQLAQPMHSQPPPQQQQQQQQQPQFDHSGDDHNYSMGNQGVYDDTFGLYQLDDGGDEQEPIAQQRTLTHVDRPVPRLQDNKPPRIPKKKPLESPMRVAETDAATAAAARRIATDEGWKLMNQWLHAAENDTNKLFTLLNQCSQAKVTVTLLSSNDTPKFVRKLSKKHEDPELRTFASGIVSAWKKLINTSDPAEEKKEKEKKERERKEKKQREEEEDEEEMPKSSTEGRRSSDDAAVEKKPEEPKVVKKEREHRVRAKVKVSKGRSLGIDIDEAPAPKQAKRDPPAPGAPPVKKSSTEKAPMTSPTAPAVPKKVVVAPPKKVMISNSFLDSLTSTATPPPKKKLQPRKVLPAKPFPRTALPTDDPNSRSVVDKLLSPTNEPKIDMNGLFSDTSRIATTAAAPAPASQVYEAEEPKIAVGRRRIRFRDEEGGELVETRFFEIEDGERINVNRFTPEEMKHHEALLEKQWKAEAGGMLGDQDDEDTQDPTVPGVMWRFVEITGFTPVIDTPGIDSQMRFIQAKRQANVIQSFFSPHQPTEHFDEPDLDAPEEEPAVAESGIELRKQPCIIPLEMVMETVAVPVDDVITILSPTPASPMTSPRDTQAPTAATQADPNKQADMDRLKNLLAGLKSAGLVNDDTKPLAEMTPPQPQPQQPQMAQIVQQNTGAYYQQEQPPMQQQHGFGMMPPRMHTIQQEFVQHPPPSMSGGPNGIGVPPMGARPGPMGGPGPMGPGGPGGPGGPVAPPGAGIQVVNLDVHAPDGGFPNHRSFVSQRPCTFFNGPRGCRFGDQCNFAHVKVDPDQLPQYGPPGGFRVGMRGDFRGGMRGGFRGRGGFDRGGFNGGGGFNRDAPPGRDRDFGSRWDRRDDRDRDMRDRRRRSRSRSRSPSPSSRHRSSRFHNDGHGPASGHDTDARPSAAAASRDTEDIDGVPIEPATGQTTTVN